MNRISGTFNTPASGDLYICIGFLPDWVKIWNTETTNEEVQFWSKNFRSSEMIGGQDIDDDGTISPVTVGAGIAPYRGGHTVTAAEATAGTYLVADPSPDKRALGTGVAINKWTLDTAASLTGHWNDVCNTTYVGEGSRIKIDGVWYTVTAVTSNGEAANEVTLNEAAPSGVIEMLTGMYDYIAAAAGKVTPKGFFIDATAEVFNATTDLSFFEAGTYA